MFINIENRFFVQILWHFIYVFLSSKTGLRIRKKKNFVSKLKIEKRRRRKKKKIVKKKWQEVKGSGKEHYKVVSCDGLRCSGCKLSLSYGVNGVKFQKQFVAPER